MMADGVFVVDGAAFKEIGFIATGMGTHGLYPSRDGRKLYVANRGSNKIHGAERGMGSVSVLDFATRKVDVTWPIPGGGSPDMGNVSADGKQLWLSGRYDNVVYVFDTTTGAVEDHPGRQGAARPHRLAAAGPLLARPHRQHALAPTSRAAASMNAPPLRVLSLGVAVASSEVLADTAASWADIVARLGGDTSFDVVVVDGDACPATPVELAAAAAQAPVVVVVAEPDAGTRSTGCAEAPTSSRPDEVASGAVWRRAAPGDRRGAPVRRGAAPATRPTRTPACRIASSSSST